MNNQIILQGPAGGVLASKEGRETARQGRTVVANVRLRGLQTDGALALAAHAMEGLVGLDDRRRRLAQDDVARNLILSEIEETALQQVKAIQRSLFDSWAL